MRVSRVQAEDNRKKVIDVASRLFREHGFDGIGLKDLMEGAGLTQGAFYKQFASKEALAAQASRLCWRPLEIGRVAEGEGVEIDGRPIDGAKRLLSRAISNPRRRRNGRPTPRSHAPATSLRTPNASAPA